MLLTVFILWILSLFVSYTTPLLWIPTTLTLLVMYLEQALARREELENELELLRLELEQHKQANQDLTSLQERVNAISLKLGFSHKGLNP